MTDSLINNRSTATALILIQVPCIHDYVLFNSKVLGFQIQNSWTGFETDRMELIRHCTEFFPVSLQHGRIAQCWKLFSDNSCGPINIEYPEYLTKTPAFASGYLQGDVVRFDCFQTHWIHGDNEFKCKCLTVCCMPNMYVVVALMCIHLEPSPCHYFR